MLSEEEVLRRFAPISLTSEQNARLEQLKASAAELALGIFNNTKNSREQALALTKLEEVVFWSRAALLIENQ